MAEGWAKKLHCNIESYSAGIEKHGLNPYAAKVMQEVGVDISSQYSKLLDDLGEHIFDYVITVCDSASEQCPIFRGKGRIMHQAFPDPPSLAENVNSEDEILAIYRQVRDEIKDFIQTFPITLT